MKKYPTIKGNHYNKINQHRSISTQDLLNNERDQILSGESLFLSFVLWKRFAPQGIWLFLALNRLGVEMDLVISLFQLLQYFHKLIHICHIHFQPSFLQCTMLQVSFSKDLIPFNAYRLGIKMDLCWSYSLLQLLQYFNKLICINHIHFQLYNFSHHFCDVQCCRFLPQQNTSFFLNKIPLFAIFYGSLTVHSVGSVVLRFFYLQFSLPISLSPSNLMLIVNHDAPQTNTHHSFHNNDIFLETRFHVNKWTYFIMLYYCNYFSIFTITTLEYGRDVHVT